MAATGQNAPLTVVPAAMVPDEVLVLAAVQHSPAGCSLWGGRCCGMGTWSTPPVGSPCATAEPCAGAGTDGTHAIPMAVLGATHSPRAEQQQRARIHPHALIPGASLQPAARTHSHTAAPCSLPAVGTRSSAAASLGNWRRRSVLARPEHSEPFRGTQEPAGLSPRGARRGPSSVIRRRLLIAAGTRPCLITDHKHSGLCPAAPPARTEGTAESAKVGVGAAPQCPPREGGAGSVPVGAGALRVSLCAAVSPRASVRPSPPVLRDPPPPPAPRTPPPGSILAVPQCRSHRCHHLRSPPAASPSFQSRLPAPPLPLPALPTPHRRPRPSRPFSLSLRYRLPLPIPPPVPVLPSRCRCPPPVSPAPLRRR